MSYGEVTLIPGINVERTPTLLQAGYSASQLIRYRDGLAQKYGGWTSYYSGTVSGVPRDLHAWQDLNNVARLGIGTTQGLFVLTSGTLTNITPQTLTSNTAFSASAGNVVAGSTPSPVNITMADTNLNNNFLIGSAFQTNVFAPALLGGIDGVIINTPFVAGNTLAKSVLIQDIFLSQATDLIGATPQNYIITTGEIGLSSIVAACHLVVFTTVSGSAYVAVSANSLPLPGINIGETIYFGVPTTGNGVTISGTYVVVQAPGLSTTGTFIIASTSATGSGSFTINGGLANYTYLLSTGYYPGSEQTGSAITPTSWTLDNWGEILLGCQSNGPMWQWQPQGGGNSAAPIPTAPSVSGGMFVSQTQQVLICWATSGNPAIGLSPGQAQNPLQVSWSTIGDYTTFTPLATNLAGSFVIPSGSTCRGGMAVANQNFIWTDVDCWAMNFIGAPDTYGFNKIGIGAGLISAHAAQQIGGIVYWMGPNQFWVASGGGVQVLPCPVWDAVFQNLNTSFTKNIRAMPNTAFGEVGWLYPSAASVSGECDSYVKLNIVEANQPWDYGSLGRSAWIDQGILGTPISADSSGNLWQQEQTNDAGGVAMTPSFTTGYFYIAEGEDYAFVDQVLPDMKWGTYSGAQSASVQLTFSAVDYTGDTPRSYGPYTMTTSTQKIDVRIRGRQMSLTLASSDSGSFWRLGKIRYRYAPDGRR